MASQVFPLGVSSMGASRANPGENPGTANPSASPDPGVGACRRKGRAGPSLVRRPLYDDRILFGGQPERGAVWGNVVLVGFVRIGHAGTILMRDIEHPRNA